MRTPSSVQMAPGFGQRKVFQLQFITVIIDFFRCGETSLKFTNISGSVRIIGSVISHITARYFLRGAAVCFISSSVAHAPLRWRSKISSSIAAKRVSASMPLLSDSPAFPEGKRLLHQKSFLLNRPDHGSFLKVLIIEISLRKIASATLLARSEGSSCSYSFAEISASPAPVYSSILVA